MASMSILASFLRVSCFNVSHLAVCCLKQSSVDCDAEGITDRCWIINDGGDPSSSASPGLLHGPATTENTSIKDINRSINNRWINKYILKAKQKHTESNSYPRKLLQTLRSAWYETVEVCLFVGCSTSQQQASVPQGRICSDNFTCCHTETEVADQTFYLTQSQYTDTRPTSPSADPITPGTWQGSHWSANFSVTGMTQPEKILAQVGFEPGIFRPRGGRLTTRPTRRSTVEVTSAYIHGKYERI